MSDEAAGIPPKRKLVADEDEPISKYTHNDSFHTEERLLDEKTADVYFIIESEDNDKPIRIPAHKSKLASKSDVFDAMFFGDMAEKGDVRMIDVSVDIFKMFLRLFYDCKVELTMENISDVTNMCNKYNVIHGLEECDTFLRSVMSPDNIIDVYELAIIFERRKLRRICEARIKANPHAVFQSNSFLECKKLVLSHILDLNFLLCAEVDIFEACISWTKAASGQEELTKEAFAEHFGDLLYKIRFVGVPPKDFACLSRRYGFLFTDDDHREIAQALLSGGSLEAKNFSKEPRQIRWNKDAIIVCDRAVGPTTKYWNFLGKSHLQMTFTSNEPLLLGEFVIELKNFIKICGDISKMVIMVSEVERPYAMCGKILEEVSKESAKTTDITFEIELPKPVLIQSGIYYTILIHVLTSVRYKSIRFAQLKNAVQLDDDITIKFHDYIRGFGEMYGFVPVLRFNRL